MQNLRRNRWRWALLGAGVLVLVLGIFAAQRVPQPPATRSAPSAPASKPPAALLTAEDYLAQGDYELDRGNKAQAIAAYSRAIELKPDFAEAYNNRAYVYMAQQDYARALTDLDRAIQLRPDYVNALMNRGDIYNYYYQIDYERAVADYDRVLALDPDAAQHTSVCGHRMLAVHHGWNVSVLGEILTRGTQAGCPRSPAY